MINDYRLSNTKIEVLWMFIDVLKVMFAHFLFHRRTASPMCAENQIAWGNVGSSDRGAKGPNCIPSENYVKRKKRILQIDYYIYINVYTCVGIHTYSIH